MRSVMFFARLLSMFLGGLSLIELFRASFAALWLTGVVPEGLGEVVWGMGFVLVGLGTALVVPMLAFFTFRAALNVRTREPDFHESPAGAAIGWFIPGWNLYKPYDSLCAIWSGTAVLLPGDEIRGPGRLVEIFWGTWVASIVASRVFGGPSESAMLGLGDTIGAALSAVSCAAGALAVVRLAQLQEELVRSEDVDRAGEPVALVAGV